MIVLIVQSSLESHPVSVERIASDHGVCASIAVRSGGQQRRRSERLSPSAESQSRTLERSDQSADLIATPCCCQQEPKPLR